MTKTKAKLFFSLAAILCATTLAAKDKSEKPAPVDAITQSVINEHGEDLYEYNNTVAGLFKVEKPAVSDKYIVFTYDTSAKFVGVAFDFEDYGQVHPFMKHTNTDILDAVTNSLLFYIMARPKDLSTIRYRLVIDGLWTTDKYNDQSEYDPITGISSSVITLGDPLPKITGTHVVESEIDGVVRKEQRVKFVYRGVSGRTVRLGGNFTNWDSYIYTFSETGKGEYTLDLALPRGRYYYSYYIDMDSFPDKTNPLRAYSDDGKVVSVITVD